MDPVSAERPSGVLDTSFWTAAYRAEVAANSLDYFAIVVPSAVEREILAPQADAPRREYPYATLFRQLRTHMQGPPLAAPPPSTRFGAGEAEAITVAEHLGATLLINERRAEDFARSCGIGVLTVPAFIVVLRIADVISDRAARRKLETIEAITAPASVAAAASALYSLTGG